MEAAPSQPYSDCQKPSLAVAKKPSSSQPEEITPDVLQYVLFGSNPVKIVNIKNRFNSSGALQLGDEKDPEFPPIRNDEEEAAVETDNRQSVKANMKLSYAVATFPDEVTLCLSSIPGTTFGVCAKQHIPVGTWIGPYEGKRVPTDQVSVEVNTSHMWEIYQDNQLDYFLDGSDENTSSWMRYIRCARHKQEQNLFAFQHNNNIFYRAFRDIPRGCELLVWYEDSYTQHMGIPVEIGNQNSPPEIGSREKHHIALRESGVSTLLGELDSPEDADSGSRPKPTELNRGQKRRSSPHTLFSMLRQETRVETSTHISQRHLKRSRLEQEISRSNSLAHSDPAVRISRAGADHNKKPSTSEPAGARHRRVINDVFDNGGEGGEFKCGQCKTTFTQRSLLNSHLCSRMPCKPYRCGHCQEAFAQPKELRMHAVVHVSEKPFKCGYCLRSFSGATTLNNHVRTHTGEKPFLCESCGKSFSQAFQLSRHRRICLQHTD